MERGRRVVICLLLMLPLLSVVAPTGTAFDACAGDAAGTDTINVPAAVYTLTLVGAGDNVNATGDLDILQGVRIVGAGAGVTIVDGNATDRVFDVSGAITLELDRLTIRNGNGVGQGGGINVQTASLVLTNGEVTNNTPTNLGGGIQTNSGSITVTASTISNNTATNLGGGINSGIGAVTVTDSTISGNTATTNNLVRAAAHDLAARPRVNRRLFERVENSERRFRSVVQHSSDVVLIIDDALTLIYASPVARPVLGLDPHALVSRHFRELVHDEDIAHLLDTVEVRLPAAGTMLHLTCDCATPMAAGDRLR